MKVQKKLKGISIAFAAGSLLISSCNKDYSGSSANNNTSTSSTIAVAANVTGTDSANTTDSIYIMQPCARGSKRDSIAQTALPANVSDYLSSNYSSYTFGKAFSLVNSSGAITGYVVVIYYNDNPVGLQFDSAGEFVKVLEQREKGDLDGDGWHRGGRFEARGGFGHDTIAISSLPSAILAYFSSNYSGDTLVKAFVGRDTSYLVLSRNNGLFATVLDASGNFVKRVELPSREGACSTIEQSALPAATLAYLDQTYPDYVFEKAYAIKKSGAVQGYVVVIDANNTKYALEFDASGNFLQAKTIS